MIALACITVLLTAFGVGFALGRRQVRTLRADVAMWRQLASDLEGENSRLRLNALIPPRHRGDRGAP